MKLKYCQFCSGFAGWCPLGCSTSHSVWRGSLRVVYPKGQHCPRCRGPVLGCVHQRAALPSEWWVQYLVISTRGQRCPGGGGCSRGLCPPGSSTARVGRGLKIRVGSTGVQHYLREAGEIAVPVCVRQRAALTSRWGHCTGYCSQGGSSALMVGVQYWVVSPRGKH